MANSTTIKSTVNKTGDTIYGHLITRASNHYIISYAIDSSSTSSTNMWDNGYFLHDKNNVSLGYFRSVSIANNGCGVQIQGERTINGNRTENHLRLLVDDNGNAKVNINQAAAWRTGLGLGSVATESIIPISKGGTGTSTSTAALQALGAVSKTGDTINGNLFLNDKNYYIKCSNIDHASTASNNTWTNGYYLKDNNTTNSDRASLRLASFTNGYQGVQLATTRNFESDDTKKENHLRLLIDNNKNAKVEINQTAAWQDALGIDNITKYIRGKRIAIFGDSISDEDIQWSTDVNDVWVKTFRTLAAKYQVGTITNYSRSSRGFCVKDNNNQYTTEEIINNTNFTNIDTIIIFCGVNDFLGGTSFGQEGVSTNGTLWKALNTIKSKIIGKQVFVITPLQTANTSNSTLKGYTLEMYRICLANWAAKNNFMLINGSAIPQFHKASGYYNDGLHPSNNSTHYIAEYILSKMLIGGEPFKECPESAEYTIAKTTNTSQATTIRFTASQNFTTMYCKINANAAIPSGEIKNGSNELGPKFDNWFYIPYTNGNYAQYAGTSIATSSSGYYEFEVSYPTKALGQR